MPLSWTVLDFLALTAAWLSFPPLRFDGHGSGTFVVPVITPDDFLDVADTINAFEEYTAALCWRLGIVGESPMTDVASNGNETCVLEDKSVIVDVDEDEAIDTLTFSAGWLDRDGVDSVVMSREMLGTDGEFSTVDVIRASGNETVLADKSMIVDDDEAEAIDTLPSDADWIDHDGVDAVGTSGWTTRGMLGDVTTHQQQQVSVYPSEIFGKKL